MSTTKYKPDTTSQGSYVQMFLDQSDKHFIDASKALPYNEVLSWGGRKHSEGMMPFMNDDYPEMDYLWPSYFPFIDPGDTGGGPGTDGDYSDVERAIRATDGWRFNCIINCETPITECANRVPIRCWYNAVTGNGTATGWELIEGPDPIFDYAFTTAPGASYVNLNMVYWPSWMAWWEYATSLSGDEFATLNVQYTDIGSPTDEWYFHPLLNKWILIKAGNSTCTAHITFHCCDDIEDLVFDDDATSDTIEAEGSIQLNLVDGTGYGPYTWTVEGQGYTLDAAETEDRANMLNADSSICDTPAGEGEADSVAWITVTDRCGSIVTFGIRHADGDWHKCYGASRSSCTPVGAMTYTYQYQDALGTYDPMVYRLGGVCGSGSYCAETMYNNIVACGNPVSWFSWFASTYGCDELDEVGLWDWRC